MGEITSYFPCGSAEAMASGGIDVTFEEYPVFPKGRHVKQRIVQRDGGVIGTVEDETGNS